MSTMTAAPPRAHATCDAPQRIVGRPSRCKACGATGLTVHRCSWTRNRAGRQVWMLYAAVEEAGGLRADTSRPHLCTPPDVVRLFRGAVPVAQEGRSAERRTPEAGRGRPQNHREGGGIDATEPPSRSDPGREAGSIPAGHAPSPELRAALALALTGWACFVRGCPGRTLRTEDGYPRTFRHQGRLVAACQPHSLYL